MKITFSKPSNFMAASGVKWDIKKNPYQPILSYIHKKEKQWRCEFTHEVGHVLSNAYLQRLTHDVSRSQIFREELLAWRLASSFCKLKYWNEHFATSCLKSYKRNTFKINWGKLKIIPLNINKLYLPPK